jgi:electron transfer flavoprotein alpha subunit
MIKQEEAKKQTGIPPVPPRQSRMNMRDSKDQIRIKTFEERKESRTKLGAQVMMSGGRGSGMPGNRM